MNEQGNCVLIIKIRIQIDSIKYRLSEKTVYRAP